MRFQYYPQ